MVIVLSLLVLRREHPALRLLVVLLMGIPISEMSQIPILKMTSVESTVQVDHAVCQAENNWLLQGEEDQHLCGCA